MSRTRVIPTIIVFDRVLSTDGKSWREVRWTSQAWRREYGRPTEANLAKVIQSLESSTAPGGANAHLGITQVAAARIVRQRDGKVLAIWQPRPFGVLGTAPRANPIDPRDEAQLSHFRALAEAMHGGEPQDWQWIGKHLSQRMFGISEKRAKEYAKLYGGAASRMSENPVARQNRAPRRKPNPKVTVFHANPKGRRVVPFSGGSVLQSTRVFEIAYKHVQDGDDYIHKFRRGVCLELLPDGSLRIYSHDGKRLWKSFNMKD